MVRTAKCAAFLLVLAQTCAHNEVLADQKAKNRPADDVLIFVRGVLRNVTAANLPDLLLITLGYSPTELAADATNILLDYDRDFLPRSLLHTDKAQFAAASAAVPTQPAAMNTNSTGRAAAPAGLGVDGIACIQKANDNGAAAQIIAQLMTICATSGNMLILQRLVKLPAAQEIGVSTLQECLQAVIKGPAAWDGLEIITSLPAARRISSDAIAGLLKEAITDRVPSIAPLLQLPEARLLGAKFALEMLPKAVVAGLGRVAVELGRFAAGLEPDAADVVSLLKTVLSNPWRREEWTMDSLQLAIRRVAPGTAVYTFHQCFTDLCRDSLAHKSWDKLTQEDLLQLLEYCTSRGYGYAWNSLTRFPVVTKIKDASRFIACFKAAQQTATAAGNVVWPERLPIASRLNSSQFYDAMQCALQSPMRAVHVSLLRAVSQAGEDAVWANEPAAHVWSTEQVQALMNLATTVHDWKTVTMLAKCPAAQQVTPQALTITLQQLLSCLEEDDATRSKREHRAYMLQHMAAAYEGEAKNGVLAMLNRLWSSVGLAWEHSNALLSLAVLCSIRHVQPEDLPLAEWVESKPLTWPAVMYITTRQPAAQQWSVECVQQAIDRSLHNIQPNAGTGSEQNANTLQLSVYIYLVRLQAGSSSSAEGLSFWCTGNAAACRGSRWCVQVTVSSRKLALLPGYAAVVEEMKTAAVNSGQSARLNGSSSSSAGALTTARSLVGQLAKRLAGVFGAVQVGLWRCTRLLSWPIRLVLRVGRTNH